MSILTRTFVTVDANTVLLETNIREIEALDTTFLDSVIEHGILVPVLGRIVNGAIIIRAGQRRTLAAQQTNQPLPVILIDGDEDTDSGLRIIEQLVENEQRVSLTTGERVKAWAQLELTGLSVTKIASVTGRSKDQVKAGLTVAKNETFAKQVENSTIDLLHLAALVEFAGYPETVDELMETALEQPDRFEHRVSARRQQIENAKLSDAAIETRLVELRAEGKTAMTSDEEPEEARFFNFLTRDETIIVDPALGDGIAWVVKASYYGGSYRETKIVTDPTKFGYIERTGSTSDKSVVLDDDAKLAARAARRRVISHNKAWDAATPVREEWVTKFLTRKTLPNDAVLATAISYTRYAGDMQSHNGHSKATTLLGLNKGDSYSGGSILAAHIDAHPTKAAHVTLALTLGNLEANTSRETWRTPSKNNIFYLEQLRAWGYSLSAVEQVAIGETDEVDDEAPENINDDFSDDDETGEN